MLTRIVPNIINSILVMKVPITFGSILLCLFATSSINNYVQAATYQFYGGPFSIINNQEPPLGSYTTAMSITGFFTVGSPLPTNMPRSDISGLITSFNFNDGRQTFTESNSEIINFSVGTEFSPTGNEIWTWQIDISNNDPFTAVGQQRGSIHLFFPDFIVLFYSDGASITECITFTTECTETQSDSGLTHNAPGTWIDVSPIPVPTAVWLFATGLIGLIGFARRKA